MNNNENFNVKLLVQTNKRGASINKSTIDCNTLVEPINPNHVDKIHLMDLHKLSDTCKIVTPKTRYISVINKECKYVFVPKNTHFGIRVFNNTNNKCDINVKLNQTNIDMWNIEPNSEFNIFNDKLYLSDTSAILHVVFLPINYLITNTTTESVNYYNSYSAKSFYIKIVESIEVELGIENNKTKLNSGSKQKSIAKVYPEPTTKDEEKNRSKSFCNCWID